MTYNGTHYDLKKPGVFAGLEDELPVKGTPTDMQHLLER